MNAAEFLDPSAWMDRLAGPRYVRLRNRIEEGIANGIFSPDAPLPPALLDAAPAAQASAVPGPADEAVESTIQNYAIMCAALEMLPQSLATMAIIPVQMKLVYAVGKEHGVELDAGHIKEFIGVVGVGMTSQVVENFARNLIGGFARGALGRTMGRGVGGLGKTAAGAAVTFSTTYALGQVAKQYYSGGRSLSAVDLKSVYAKNVDQAKGLYEKFAPQVENKASSMNMLDVGKLVKGGV